MRVKDDYVFSTVRVLNPGPSLPGPVGGLPVENRQTAGVGVIPDVFGEPPANSTWAPPNVPNLVTGDDFKNNGGRPSMVTATITLNDGTVKQMSFDDMDSALAYANANHGTFTGFNAQTIKIIGGNAYENQT